MEITPSKSLFWFLKDDIKLELSDPSTLEMYVQQVVTHGRAEDVKSLFKIIGFTKFKETFLRLKFFLPLEVRKFWEDFFGTN